MPLAPNPQFDRFAKQFAEEDFLHWAKEATIDRHAGRDDLHTLSLIASEIYRHQSRMQALHLALAISDKVEDAIPGVYRYARYLPNQAACAEIDTLDEVMCPEACRVVRTNHAELCDMLDGKPVKTVIATTNIHHREIA